MNKIFEIGQRVKLKNSPNLVGAISDIRFTKTGTECLVFFNANRQDWYSSSSLVQIDRLKKDVKFIEHDEFLKDLVLIKLKSQLTDVLFSYKGSRTNVEPYQFKPALSFLDSENHRLMLADEVGLGKTIEAGIILLELKARLDIRRVLVVCPAGLREKWRQELSQRFGEEFEIFDQKSFMDKLEKFSNFGTALSFKGIISIELLRSKSINQEMIQSGLSIDLTIVDEAHHLRNPDSDTYSMGSTLSDLSDAMLMLTATPVQLRSDDLFHLLNILDEANFSELDQFDDVLIPNAFVNSAIRILNQNNIESLHSALRELKKVEGTTQRSRYIANPLYSQVCKLLANPPELSPGLIVDLKRDLRELSPFGKIINRTMKRDVTPGAQRTPYIIEVELSENELNLYETFLNVLKEQYLKNHPDAKTVHPFAIIQRERQAASSLKGIGSYIEDLTKNLNLELEVEDESNELDVTKIVSLEETEVSKLDLLFQSLKKDSKLEQLKHSLNQVVSETPQSKILIFSYFKRTLNYLKESISNSGIIDRESIFLINGEIPINERLKIVDKFKNLPSGGILLLSEVGAEGQDFQFCDVLMNYDLPWNPMRVEQRIGRIDRYGQKNDRIRIYSFTLKGTIEERILSKLYKRIGVFEQSIGELEPILGTEIRDLETSIFKDSLTPKQQEVKLEQILESIEYRKREDDKFREEQQKFLGQGEMFVEEFEAAMLSGRYLSGNEFYALINTYIKNTNKNSSLVPRPNDERLFLFKPSNEFKMAIQQKMTDLNYPRESSTVLREHLGNVRGFPVTFDGEFAVERPLLEFINLRHPITQTAVDHFIEIAPVDPMLRICNLVTDVQDGIKGDFCFFIYLMNITSADSQGSLVPIVFDSRSFLRRKDLESSIMKYISSNSRESNSKHDLDWSMLNDLSFDEFILERNKIKSDHELINQARIESRISSITQTYHTRIARYESILQKMIASNGDSQIIRMRQGQISNTSAELESRINDLNSRRGVDVGGELQLMGHISFTGEISVPDENSPTNSTIFLPKDENNNGPTNKIKHLMRHLRI